MIEVKNLSKSYGKNKVLQGVDASFNAGAVYGIVGNNGAGKSTFFKCIADLTPSNGEVKYHKGELRKHLGYLETHPQFLSYITGEEYLQLMCNARNISSQNFADKNIFDLPLNQYVTQYSTGMKKKLALLAIILQKNDVFILDEPFSGVDIHSNMIIMDIIERLAKTGKIILIASHIFQALNQTCDGIYLLENGTFSTLIKPVAFKSLEDKLKSFVLGAVDTKLDGLIGE